MHDDMYYGEAPNLVKSRRFKVGHIMRHPILVDGFDNLYIIRCEGPECGWFSAPFMRNSDAEEHAERAAYAHRTEPCLLVKGSSDVLPNMRNATVQDLVAKLKSDESQRPI